MTQQPEEPVSIAQKLAYRLWLNWQSVRPIPLPRYLPGTPKIGGDGPLDIFFPPTAQTLGAAAMSEEAFDFVGTVLERLTPGDVLASQQFYYRWGRTKFGKHWRYANLPSTLCAAAISIQPRAYLEIGVHRGRSAAVVGAIRPDCAIYGFDLWIPVYAGVESPGPDFVREELRIAGHTGPVALISGDSRKTVPAFLREHPDLYFDLITIDGDKSVAGVAADFASALPRLKVGGIVVSDDIPMFPRLERIWDRVIRRDSRYITWEFYDAARGVVAAIRISDRQRLQ